jgi:CubicO group peptidase (beta-lactamase class C family)
VLARVLEVVTHKPLARLIRDDVLRPGGLTQTRSFTTAEIPAPVLHTFTSERRQVLGIRPTTPFYEESTYWNPSWTSATGSVETSTITDLTKTADLLGNGRLLSPASHRVQITPALTGFGHTSPTCPACALNTVKRSYGLGVILRRDWITTTKQFAGSDATIADLRFKRSRSRSKRPTGQRRLMPTEATPTPVCRWSPSSPGSWRRPRRSDETHFLLRTHLGTGRAHSPLRRRDASHRL